MGRLCVSVSLIWLLFIGESASASCVFSGSLGSRTAWEGWTNSRGPRASLAFAGLASPVFPVEALASPSSLHVVDTPARRKPRVPFVAVSGQHKQEGFTGAPRCSEGAVSRLHARAVPYLVEAESTKETKQKAPSAALRAVATGCYLFPIIDTLQAFAPVPSLGRLAGRLAWSCNILSMGVSFLFLRKKLIPAPPFLKHHLMTASLLSMCSFTLANIHYKVLSFFIAGRTTLQESLAFAAGASLLSLIAPAALSATRGRAAALPVLSEAVSLHLGPDDFGANEDPLCLPLSCNCSLGRALQEPQAELTAEPFPCHGRDRSVCIETCKLVNS
ncbi:hypothetical protein cyc_03024 [Cyclospora cayetanensis]|uniref:Transmembrane protein n=1 Tax=Cyclospora cayetanensis TaxID=88456 RepID=A0A1D3CX11_9EIME|nr:hypothetical protein cyc_03024 [Cyclospora cayetanensis]